MISFDRSPWRMALWLAGGVLAAAVVYNHFKAETVAPDTLGGPSGAASASEGGRTSANQIARAASALMSSTPEVAADGRPVDFEVEEWNVLKEAISKGPNSASELQRVAQYLRFQRSFERWQNLKDEPGAQQERTALGNRLLASLPVHLGNSEMTIGEAVMLCTAVVNEQPGDDLMRQQKTEQCKTRLEQSVPVVDAEIKRRDEACLTEWEERKNAITREFLKKSPEQRVAEQRQFEAELEKARVDIYGSPRCGGQ